MPDIYGFETPQEAQERVRSRFTEASQRISSMGHNATPGQRLGASLSNIFGPSLQKFVDTRKARKQAEAELVGMGMNPDVAKQEAKRATPAQYSEVRKAEKMQQYTEGADELVSKLVEDGVGAEVARGAGLLFISNKLKQSGSAQDKQMAAQLSLAAGQLFDAEEERIAKLDKVKADTDHTRQSTLASMQAMKLAAESDDDTYVKFDEKGKLVRAPKSVAAGDTDQRAALRADGWINIGQNAFGVQLDKDIFKAPAPADMSDMTYQLGLLDSLSVMEGIEDKVGFGTPFQALLAERGISAFGSGELIDAVAHQRNVRAGIQSLIKGIPSNYDASVFEAMIPNLFRFQDKDYYSAQVDVLQNSAKELIRLNIAAHKGSNKPLSKDLLISAQRAGIDVASIQGIPAKDFTAHADRVFETSIIPAIEGLNAIQPVDEIDTSTPVDDPGLEVRRSLIERINQAIQE